MEPRPNPGIAFSQWCGRNVTIETVAMDERQEVDSGEPV